MGAVTRIAITGAAGYLGRAALAEARRAGIEVLAITRGAPRASWAQDAGIVSLQADLSDPASRAPLAAALTECQAVIHAAAHLGDDPARHAADTVAATQILLEAMARAGMPRLVLISSIAVYDTARLPIGGTVSETCPLDDPATCRDGYVAAKIEQEALARAATDDLWILRPGVVYGPGRVWNAHVGKMLGPVLVKVGTEGDLPLVHVGRCAWAMVRAAQTDPGGQRALNVLDTDLPDRARFLRAFRAGGWRGVVVPVPWPVWLGLARVLKPLGGRLPGLFREPVLRSRMMPLRYDRRSLERLLGKGASARFEALFAAAMEGKG